ncbi:uncharacterized protein BXZ73DRAFT_41530 [Epithele typhae]|uniref:uncharacterized protein n=1 Tax=Epithele typhae TaxID=378194 RepID=UPI0020072939|nr:uncharacterized protein BXZ73DRAFT_41530 [Epithele typhae]KAH9941607.1 hypothetical protein BXZ73DRAFT_41530 [Epithele typhae]
MPSAIRHTLAVLPFAAVAAAYSFNIVSTPRQCQTLEVDITGSGGSPPYSLLLVPTGPTPLANQVEARRITEVPFNTSSSVSFQLKFPENSQFIAVVSDSNGFGTGGTSSVATVLDSNDASCFDATTSVQTNFFFHTFPDGFIATCQPTRLWWDPTQVNGTVTFKGVIPGGESFTVPQNTTTSVLNEGTGFTWVPNLRIGTQVVMVVGDDRGVGTGGSNQYTLQQSDVTSCLNSSSPSSTPGSPAGGSYPTSTDGSGTGRSNSSTNVGAIVGGVVGGVVGALAIALLLLFYIRRKRFHNEPKERPVDLLNDEHDEEPVGDQRLPEYYRPEPFMLPDPTAVSADGSVHGGSARPSTEGRRQSYLTTSTSDAGGAGYMRHGTSVPSTSTRKSPAPPTFRPVNIIQHDDAGPSEEPPAEAEAETIELPPAYTNIKPRGTPGAPSSVGADDGESHVGGVDTSTRAGSPPVL